MGQETIFGSKIIPEMEQKKTSFGKNNPRNGTNKPSFGRQIIPAMEQKKPPSGKNNPSNETVLQYNIFIFLKTITTNEPQCRFNNLMRSYIK